MRIIKFTEKAFFIVSVLSSVSLMISAPIEYSNGLIRLAYIEFGCTVIILLNLIHYAKYRLFEFSSFLFIFVITFLFYFIVLENARADSLVWFLILPVITSLFLGLKTSAAVIFFQNAMYIYLLHYVKYVAQERINIPFGAVNFILISLASILHEYTRHRTNLAFQNLSITDSLTGAYNRRFFEQILEENINAVQKRSENLSLLIFDLDFFKKVNDQFGHKTGDSVLKEIVILFKENLRPFDRIFRIGGEEFCVIFSGTSVSESEIITKRIFQKISEHTFSHKKNLTISAGLSGYRENDSLEDLLHRADTALYLAKRKGRNRLIIEEA